jgi:hypothetical protein
MMLLGITGALLILTGLAVWVGSRLPKTHIAASRIVLKAAPTDVWCVMTNFRKYSDWRPGLVRVEEGPEVNGLPSWYEVCGFNARVHFRVAESDPPYRWVTHLDDTALPLAGVWVYELRAVDGGTELTITEQDRIYNPLLRFFARFVIAYHGVMDVFLIALARSLEESVQPEHLSVPVAMATPDP